MSGGSVRASPEPWTTQDGNEPRAWSMDGVTFEYRSPIAAPVRLGGYVLITARGGEYMGQVLSKDVVDAGGHRAVQEHGA